jgi:hypothetical protein
MNTISSSSWSPKALAAALGLTAALVLGGGCNDDPTMVQVENDYPLPGDTGAAADTVIVFKAWWVTTLFVDPVAPGAISEPERTIPSQDFAYVLIAPGWSPDSGGRPSRLIALKSRQPLSATAHGLLTISVSDGAFAGDCAAGGRLDADDALLIVERIFPGDFAGTVYDPATCTTTPAPADAGPSADAGSD